MPRAAPRDDEEVNKLISVVLVLAAAIAAHTGCQTPVLALTAALVKRPVPAAEAQTGWVPVAYGEAEVSVPPAWVVMASCGGTWPSIVQLCVVTQDMDCPAPSTAPTVRITSLGTIPAPYAQEEPVRINGVPALPGRRNSTSISCFVPCDPEH